jgi:hypothetical protein
MMTETLSDRFGVRIVLILRARRLSTMDGPL